MILVNIVVLAAVALLVWWLTGHDKNISGESKRDRHLSRAIRTVAVVFLMALLLWFPSPLMMFVVPVPVALILRSCVSEIFAHGFVGFLDPSLHDSRTIDLNQTQRYKDTIAHLIHHGHKDEAIKLCEDLKQSGEVDLTTLESTLEFLGVKQDRGTPVRPVTEAARLRAQGKFSEAETLLKSLLNKNPADADAAMMLMRLYAQDLRQPARAVEVLRALENEPGVARAHIDFARHSIDDWSRSGPETPKPAGVPETAAVDELLAQGFFGSAMEQIEQKIKEQPADPALRVKLAEIHARHCHNLLRAEKIIRQLEGDPRFTPEQAADARARLKEWHQAHLQRK